MRYERQIAVDIFAQAGQERLLCSHVLIIGAGGLAAPVLQYLVGAGVGRVTLIDPDVVDESNLHRQTIFRSADVGHPKALAAAGHMQQLNPDCHMTPLVAAFDPQNGEQLCELADVVLDCADSFAVSYTASDICERLGRPLISASVVETSGYCGGFCGAAPSLRAVFPDLPDQLGSCRESGVLGPCVGVIGSLQAQMALAVLIYSTPSPLGQVLRFDGQSFRTSSFRFDRCENPPHTPSFIAISQVRDDDVVIDLRDADEEGPRLEYAVNMRVDEISQDLIGTRSGRVVLACRSGLRAWRAAQHISKWRKEHIFLLALGSGEHHYN